MKKVKLLVVLILVFVLQIAGSVTAQAVESNPVPETSTENMTTVSPRADQYVTYYRTYNGHRQYRIWNKTKGVWVTDWKDVES